MFSSVEFWKVWFHLSQLEKYQSCPTFTNEAHAHPFMFTAMIPPR